MLKLVLPALLWLLLTGQLFAQTKVIPFQELPTAGGQASGSGMFFGATMNTTAITLTFTGPSDRWIAFGLGQSMFPADLLVYSNGKAGAIHVLGWNDYYNSSGSAFGVNNDVQQNWTIVSTATVASGQRTVTATRALSTGDANDIAITYSASALDVIWAKGATPDYTIAYHGNTNRAYLISLPWLSMPTASFVASNTVCVGSALSFTNLSSGGLTSYTWNFQGGNPAVSTLTNPSVSYSTPGTYSVALTASNALGSSTYTQVNYVTVLPTVTPSVSIGLSGTPNPLCQGSLATFTLSAINVGSNGVFQWRVGGVNAGNNSTIMATTLPAGVTSVDVVLMSGALCAAPPTVTSAAISVTVNSNAPASVSTAIVSGSNPMCVGAAAVFSATTGNAGTAPQIIWGLNGAAAATGATYNAIAPANGDVVTCTLISNAACASNSVGMALPITLTVSSVLTPSVNLTAQPNPVCTGATVTFSATTLNGGSNPGLNWLVNNQAVASNTPAFSTSSLTGLTQVSVQLVPSLACASPSLVSASVVLTVNPTPPAPSIMASGALSLCAGQNLTLTSSAATGNTWYGAQGNQSSITVGVSGSYSVTQTLNGCTSPLSTGLSVTVHPLPSASVTPIAPLCLNGIGVDLQGSPPGGSFTGPASPGGYFDPAVAGLGGHIVIYQYTNTFGCTDTAALIVEVEACLSLEQAGAEGQRVLVYPNPVADLLYVKAPFTLRTIHILDAMAKPAMILRGEDLRGVVNVACLPEGIYLLELHGDGLLVRLRFNRQAR